MCLSLNKDENVVVEEPNGGARQRWRIFDTDGKIIDAFK
jgi:hypothetical protein